MRFRVHSSHATCTECVKHKVLIASLGHHLAARRMQQSLLYAHLASQFRDRCEYWRKRGCSRSRGPEVIIISDGMDQGKFAVPRHPAMRAKQFDSWSRPRLHVAATIAHGWLLDFFVSEANLCKDSNTSIEILASTMTRLTQLGCDLPSSRVTIQADNTCREVKNGHVMRWASSLVSDHRCQEICMSFLRSGHSHEDIDQVFGSAADWIRRRLPRAESSEDVVTSLQGFLASLERPHEGHRRCFKLDGTRDWRLCVMFCSGCSFAEFQTSVAYACSVSVCVEL